MVNLFEEEQEPNYGGPSDAEKARAANVKHRFDVVFNYYLSACNGSREGQVKAMHWVKERFKPSADGALLHYIPEGIVDSEFGGVKLSTEYMDESFPLVQILCAHQRSFESLLGEIMHSPHPLKPRILLIIKQTMSNF